MVHVRRCEPSNVAAVALANRNARVLWALLRTGQAYRAARSAAAPMKVAD
jgi:hypothetical protein